MRVYNPDLRLHSICFSMCMIMERYRIIALVITMIGVSACKPVSDPIVSVVLQGKTYTEGDMLCEEDKEEESFDVFKILKIEQLAEDDYILHLMWWSDFDQCPTVEEVKMRRGPIMRHFLVPLRKNSPPEDGIIIGNDPVTSQDLDGYNEYLENIQK